MLASTAFRSSLRAARAPAARRFASTSTEKTAEAAQQKAQDYAKLATEYGQKALDATKKALGPVGEKVGNSLGAYRKPITYNLSVAREFLKQVYITERLQPPTSLGTVTSAYSTLWARASNPAYWREISRTGEWQKVGVYALEAYGLYKIGEILGRRSLVGYSTH